MKSLHRDFQQVNVNDEDIRIWHYPFYLCPDNGCGRRIAESVVTDQQNAIWHYATFIRSDSAITSSHSESPHSEIGVWNLIHPNLAGALYSSFSIQIGISTTLLPSSRIRYSVWQISHRH